MDVKIHVQGVKGSVLVRDEPDALFRGVLEVDGHLIVDVSEIDVHFEGDDFVSVRPNLIAGSIEVVPHDKESWDALLNGESV